MPCGQYKISKNYVYPYCHRENGGGPLGWGPLNNQPHIHLIARGYILDIFPFKGYQHFPYDTGLVRFIYENQRKPTYIYMYCMKIWKNFESL